MNRTYNINIGGLPFIIDDDAFDYLNNYLDAVNHQFSTSEGCEEIVTDIEIRMAELFLENLKGRKIISKKDVELVISILGKPEDFGDVPPMEDNPLREESERWSASNLGMGKRLFRDTENKKIAGICAGLSNYFGITDFIWMRLLFVILFFSGPGVIIYLVLWVLVPEAKTAGDKLMMRGEAATIGNIAREVENELTGLGDKINDWAQGYKRRK